MNDSGRLLADIAADAGRLILPLWRAGGRVDLKADSSPVTEADRRAEEFILARLAEAFPGVPVIAEEEVAADGAPSAIASAFFLVDPLDGTKAFVGGREAFTVNIALVENGSPVVGAVGAPAMGRLWFTAEGAALERAQDGAERPVRVRTPPAGEVVGLLSHTMPEEKAQAQKARFGYDRWVGMDSSVKFCLIASGEADVYPRTGRTMEWDIAAGHAVLEAAGGSVTALDGAPMRYGKAEVGFENPGFVARGAQP